MAKGRDDWLLKAGQAWAVLTKVAAKKELTTYKQLGAAIGLHHRAVRFALGAIQEYCLDTDMPILAAIVVNAARGRPGGGSVVSGRKDFSEIQAEVFDFPWDAHPNPFSAFGVGETADSLAYQLVHDPDRGEDVYAKVRVRGMAQRVFRAALLKVYDDQCAMCGLTFTEVLEAAHIVRWPDATPAQRMDTRNGLLLCATHHRLFDARLITAEANFSIRYYDPSKTELAPYSGADLQASVDLHGKRLRLPADKKHWPDAAWLKQRNADDGWDD